MRIQDCDWQAIEDYLKRDDRVVLPLGSTEQHARLSLCTDVILAEKVAIEASEPLGVPVYPALPYGLTPYFMAYPGTVSLRLATYLALIEDILESLASHGFRRIVIINGHGGNQPAASLAREWACRKSGLRVKFHNWWNGPETRKILDSIDSVASHASWMESFPWTRPENVLQPEGEAGLYDLARLHCLNPQEVRACIGIGNYGGAFRKPDEVMEKVWQAGVEEVRRVITEDWP